MANADNAFGFKPVRYLNGAPYNGQARRYYIPSGDTTAAYYIGTLVKPAGSADADGVPTVTGVAATAEATIGPIVAVEPITRESTIYRENSTSRYVWVADDPNLIFEVQEDSEGGALDADNVMNTADIIGFTAGSAATGLSGMEIDSNTATDSGNGSEDVLILALARRPDNVIGTNAVWEVRLNNHFYVDGIGGA